jgi:DNA repair protein RecO (recombination protein O)
MTPCASTSGATAASADCPDNEMTLYRDEGVVLRTIKLGESDRIVSFITKGHGKVRAVAKGVRKTKSRFGGRLEPCSHVSLLFYEGRGELDIVSQADTIEQFRPIREDLDRVGSALTLLEAVDQVAQEGEANVRLYQMLVGALRTLSARNAPLLVPAFFWKLLSLEGAHPLLEQCAGCGAEDNLVAFDLVEGGVLCRDCRRGGPVSPEALVLIRRSLGGDLAGVLEEPESKITHEVGQLASRALEVHLERRLRSLHILER